VFFRGFAWDANFSLSHCLRSTNNAVILSIAQRFRMIMIAGGNHTIAHVEQIPKNLRNEVEGSTHLRDILGQIGA
jgi:hypothetical protein